MTATMATYADEKKIPEILERVSKSDSHYERMRDNSLFLKRKIL